MTRGLECEIDSLTILTLIRESWKNQNSGAALRRFVKVVICFCALCLFDFSQQKIQVAEQDYCVNPKLNCWFMCSLQTRSYVGTLHGAGNQKAGFSSCLLEVFFLHRRFYLNGLRVHCRFVESSAIWWWPTTVSLHRNATIVLKLLIHWLHKFKKF